MVAEQLGELIRENAPAAKWSSTSGGVLGSKVSLGAATLSLSPVEQAGEEVWGIWKPGFQVIVHSAIQVRFPADQYQYEGRSHSLWFCDAQEAGAFRWFETAFMVWPLNPIRPPLDPFAFPPGQDAGKALHSGINEYQVAWPFTPIEPGNEADFLDRWIGWFAQAAQGQLSHPSSMLERPVGAWRR
jgi:eukaryotic-like serine/threonine-protein kinase